MSGILDYLSRLFGGLVFWVVVLPWQQAIRVRAGRHVRLLEAGVYLKIPALDTVRVESVRQRTAMAPTQTLTTSDGATVTVGIIVRYAIGDLERLYCRLHHADDAIIQMAQSLVAAEVYRTPRAALDPGLLCEALTEKMAGTFVEYGLTDVSLMINDFAIVRAIRLIQDQRWSHTRALDTSDSARAPS